MQSPKTPVHTRQFGESFGFNDSVFLEDMSPSFGFKTPVKPNDGDIFMMANDGGILTLETMGSPQSPAVNKENRPLPSDVWEGDVRTIHIDLSDFPGAKSFGFFLRGWEGTPRKADLNEDTQQGQYIRAVDFGGPAHTAGLRSGDRVLAVNGTVGPAKLHAPNKHTCQIVVQWCHKASHATALILIRAAGSRLALGVISDQRVRKHSLAATSRLLHERHEVVLHPITGAPVFTLEMLDRPLGRTKYLAASLNALAGVVNAHERGM